MHEESDLVQSSGGVFEVEDRGTLLFSKKALGRFPMEGELLSIIKSMEGGMSLEEAKDKAGADAPKPISFFDWMKGILGGRASSKSS